MIWRLWVQTPLETIFGEIYFVLCTFRSVRNAYRENLNYVRATKLCNRHIVHILTTSLREGDLFMEEWTGGMCGLMYNCPVLGSLVLTVTGERRKRSFAGVRGTLFWSWLGEGVAVLQDRVTLPSFPSHQPGSGQGHPLPSPSPSRTCNGQDTVRAVCLLRFCAGGLFCFLNVQERLCYWWILHKF